MAARVVVEQSWPNASLGKRVVAGKALNALLECLCSGNSMRHAREKWPAVVGSMLVDVLRVDFWIVGIVGGP